MPESGCCAQHLMSLQRDFQEQKGWLQEELEAEHQEVIFYPKFHCELNFIKCYWCSTKHYMREIISYTVQGLREILPSTLASIPSATINRYYHHCIRMLEGYASGLDYGTQAFKNRVYSSHRQVVDKSKW